MGNSYGMLAKWRAKRNRGYTLTRLALLLCAVSFTALAGDASTDRAIPRVAAPLVPLALSEVKCLRADISGADCVVCSDPRSFSPAVACAFPKAAQKPKPKAAK